MLVAQLSIIEPYQLLNKTKVSSICGMFLSQFFIVLNLVSIIMFTYGDDETKENFISRLVLVDFLLQSCGDAWLLVCKIFCLWFMYMMTVILWLYLTDILLHLMHISLAAANNIAALRSTNRATRLGGICLYLEGLCVLLCYILLRLFQFVKICRVRSVQLPGRQLSSNLFEICFVYIKSKHQLLLDGSNSYNCFILRCIFFNLVGF